MVSAALALTSSRRIVPSVLQYDSRCCVTSSVSGRVHGHRPSELQHDSRCCATRMLASPPATSTMNPCRYTDDAARMLASSLPTSTMNSVTTLMTPHVCWHHHCQLVNPNSVLSSANFSRKAKPLTPACKEMHFLLVILDHVAAHHKPTGPPALACKRPSVGVGVRVGLKSSGDGDRVHG
jgi:hypothetical protein